MGAFLLVIVSLLIALIATLMPFGMPGTRITGYVSPPSLQGVAANMIQYHQAVVSFVSLSANSGTSWTFRDSDQRTVRCSASYTSGAYGGSCPNDQFTIPGFLPALNSTYAGGSQNLVNWRVHYDSTSRVVVTYAISSSDVAGYTAAQVAASLAQYNLASTYSGWYWGQMSGSSPFTLSNGTTTVNLPASCAALTGGEACAANLVGIATVIP